MKYFLLLAGNKLKRIANFQFSETPPTRIRRQTMDGAAFITKKMEADRFQCDRLPEMEARFRVVDETGVVYDCEVEGLADSSAQSRIAGRATRRELPPETRDQALQVIKKAVS